MVVAGSVAAIVVWKSFTGGKLKGLADVGGFYLWGFVGAVWVFEEGYCAIARACGLEVGREGEREGGR